MQDGYLLEGSFVDSVDVLNLINLKKLISGQDVEPGLRLRQRELFRGLREGDFDIFGLSIERFDSDVGLCLVGDEFFVD